MPAKPGVRYVVKSPAGPFSVNQIVTRQEAIDAGLDPDFLVRIGIFDIAAEAS